MNTFEFGQDNVQIFGICCLYNKATKRQTDIKHDNDENLAECQLMNVFYKKI